ncbi:hypothetical protein YSA_04458 [Pseudomonas putida ND6]|uniref:Uncharacterized protein n=1 Tax=Pseudomonas putida ND6 TaxID=231023 RepID=I3UUL4_PSEPU|nr:hypothetical protein YSA_04458 [Pseudomonas putida ND6]
MSAFSLLGSLKAGAIPVERVYPRKIQRGAWHRLRRFRG